MRRTALITIISAVLLSCCPVFAQDRSAGLNLSCNELAAAIHLPLDDEGILCVSANLDLTCVLSGKELLTHAGKISAEIAKQKADMEYDKFKERTQYDLSPVEIHFLENFEKEQKKIKRK